MTYLLNRRLFKNGVGSTLAKIECDAGCFVVGLDGLRNPESGIRNPGSGIHTSKKQVLQICEIYFA